VFSIYFAYNKNERMLIVDQNGSPIVALYYQGKTEFQHQVLHMINKIGASIESLKPLPPNIKPYIKMTYFEERTPDNYEPSGFQSCLRAYDLDPNIRTSVIGGVDVNLCSAAFDIQSVYIDEDITKYNDKVYESLQSTYEENTSNISMATDNDVTQQVMLGIETPKRNEPEVMSKEPSPSYVIEQARTDDHQDELMPEAPSSNASAIFGDHQGEPMPEEQMSDASAIVDEHQSEPMSEEQSGNALVIVEEEEEMPETAEQTTSTNETDPRINSDNTRSMSFLVMKSSVGRRRIGKSPEDAADY